MKRIQAQKRLEKLGFTMHKDFIENSTTKSSVLSLFGTITPEIYQLKNPKDHFKPWERDVYVSTFNKRHGGFFYVTSHIKGQKRRFRARTWNNVELVNIFASGKTLQETIEKFEFNFKNKIYNVSA